MTLPPLHAVIHVRDDGAVSLLNVVLNRRIARNSRKDWADLLADVGVKRSAVKVVPYVPAGKRRKRR
jgi:hypothetical protein